jgi:hypothetical protein
MKNLVIYIVLQLLIFNTAILQTQWIQTSGPGGGIIRCLAVSGTNIFAGIGNGVYLSIDNGTKWTPEITAQQKKLC